MDEHKIWKFLRDELKNNKSAVLLLVVESKGSSPGRAGFKLALSVSGKTVGTIGGGRVEHMLVSQAKEMLKSVEDKLQIIKQVHNEEDTSDSSGMICSGEQTVIIYPLDRTNLETIESCLSASENFNKTHLVLTPYSFEFHDGFLKHDVVNYLYESEAKWFYKENISKLTEIYIFGAGHVCLALCGLLHKLDFYISIYDDRENFSMMNENNFAHRKMVISYDSIAENIENNSEAYYLIMTHSHLGDSKVLFQLINKPHKYLGMLGSPSKVKEVYEELLNKGIPKEKLLKVHAPVGVPIHSKTVEEIAISIAAEVIKIKNE